jgi:hypothetical protein
MSDLTSELNLALAVDDDDQADYLVTTAGLRGSLVTIDGLFSSSTGHTHGGAHQGGSINPSQFPDGSINGSKLIDLSVLGAKLAAATITPDKLAAGMLESLFAGTSATVPGATYTVAAGIMYVFCQAVCTVTFPAITTNRPIEVWALNGQVTLAGGTFVGGSINLATGAVQNGVIVTGDAITYKSDGTSWRAG